MCVTHQCDWNGDAEQPAAIQTLSNALRRVLIIHLCISCKPPRNSPSVSHWFYFRWHDATLDDCCLNAAFHSRTSTWREILRKTAVLPSNSYTFHNTPWSAALSSVSCSLAWGKTRRRRSFPRYCAFFPLQWPCQFQAFWTLLGKVQSLTWMKLSQTKKSLTSRMIPISKKVVYEAGQLCSERKFLLMKAPLWFWLNESIVF